MSRESSAFSTSVFQYALSITISKYLDGLDVLYGGGGDSYLTFLATWSASLLHLLSTRNDSKGPVMTSSLKVIGETCTSMIVHTLRDVPTSHSLPRAAEQRQLLWSWTLLDAC